MCQNDFNKTLLSTIQKRQSLLSLRNAYQNLLMRILCCILFFWFFFTHVFLLTSVSGNNMFPSVKDGDLLLLFRLPQTYVKGDILLYNVDGTPSIGRLTAAESDVVSLDDTGTLLVNDTPQQDVIFSPAYAKDTLNYPYTVPDNHVFVIGDFPAQSIDSRDFGAIPLQSIKGKVITLLRHRGI